MIQKSIKNIKPVDKTLLGFINNNVIIKLSHPIPQRGKTQTMTLIDGWQGTQQRVKFLLYENFIDEQNYDKILRTTCKYPLSPIFYG